MSKQIICPVCSNTSHKSIGHYNRALKLGLNLFCGRKCAGIHRRTNKSKEQRLREKSDYDKIYRAKNREKIKNRNKEWFLLDYKNNPDKYKKRRVARKLIHWEYL